LGSTNVGVDIGLSQATTKKLKKPVTLPDLPNPRERKYIVTTSEGKLLHYDDGTGTLSWPKVKIQSLDSHDNVFMLPAGSLVISLAPKQLVWIEMYMGNLNEQMPIASVASGDLGFYCFKPSISYYRIPMFYRIGYGMYGLVGDFVGFPLA